MAMIPQTTIRNMLANNEIIVPNYQRAYSWDTPQPKIERKTHTDVFLSDLEEYQKSTSATSYYFGHFLFEKREKDNTFYVIDGQQRLTTIIIFLSALFEHLESIRELTDEELNIKEDMIKRRSTYRFSTVGYDNQLFIDYVINKKPSTNKRGLETESAKRIVAASDYFIDKLSKKEETYLTNMLKIITDASCTTHVVNSQPEAVQMFIFQQNRGKKPSNLEVIKAQFMYSAHLYGGDETSSIIKEIKNRFNTIYKSISSIEHKIDEDDVLTYTSRVYFNSLSKENILEEINEKLTDLEFIKNFSRDLESSFTYLKKFFNDEKDVFEIHSLITLGGIGIAYPFIIKSYQFGLDIENIKKLCVALESLILRHRLIGTRAEITTRLNGVFDGFTREKLAIEPIVERIGYLKTTTDWWWAYWNNDELANSLQRGINFSVAKYLLWKYENYLRNLGESEYDNSIRFGKITRPELEHIAPQTEPEKKTHGYGKYDEDFKNNYLDCLGNYLLISKKHNCAIGNRPFQEKHETYTYLEQQKEIQRMCEEDKPLLWNKKKIQQRKEKIIKFIFKTF
jgi:hypothetical protein